MIGSSYIVRGHGQWVIGVNRHSLVGSQEFKWLPFQSSLLSSQNITGKQNQTTKHNLPTRYNNLSISELQVNNTETPGTCLYSFRQFWDNCMFACQGSRRSSILVYFFRRISFIVICRWLQRGNFRWSGTSKRMYRV